MRILRRDDLADGRPVRVLVNDQPVLIALVDDEPYAISDTCPHNGLSLSQGVLRDGCITCPGHFWRFSLRDGSKQGGPTLAVPTYRCWVEDDWIAVDVPPPPPPRSMREILLEHARQPRA